MLSANASLIQQHTSKCHIYKHKSNMIYLLLWIIGSYKIAINKAKCTCV